MLNYLNLDDLFENCLHYVYPLNHRPAAIVAMSLDHKIPLIKAIVALPGARYAGGALIEKMVNKSVELGHHGIVALGTTSAEAIEAYRHYGFEVHGEVTDRNGAIHVHMILKPEGNPAWEKKDGQRILSAHAEKKYLESFGRPLSKTDL
jgi:hypothetical protein